MINTAGGPRDVYKRQLLRFSELGTVALIEDKYNLPLIDRQVAFALHEVVQLLNGDVYKRQVLFSIQGIASLTIAQEKTVQSSEQQHLKETGR